MQVREHAAITEKMLRQAVYYTRWYCCMNHQCRTTLVMPEEHRVCIAGQVTRGEEVGKQAGVREAGASVTTGGLWSEDQANVEDRPPWE